MFNMFVTKKKHYVLDKTLKCIRGVGNDNQKVLRAPGPMTKYFERLFCRSINYIYYIYI